MIYRMLYFHQVFFIEVRNSDNTVRNGEHTTILIV